MEYVSEFDEHQLKMMYKFLIAFEKKKINLISIVGYLEPLYRALKYYDKQWSEEFFKEWETLEEINATEIINESRKIVSDFEDYDKEKLIKKSVSKLKYLIKKRVL